MSSFKDLRDRYMSLKDRLEKIKELVVSEDNENYILGVELLNQEDETDKLWIYSSIDQDLRMDEYMLTLKREQLMYDIGVNRQRAGTVLKGGQNEK